MGVAIRRNPWIWTVVSIAAIAAVLWFAYTALRARGFDWALAAGSLARLRWQWLLISLVPIVGTYYGRALRWAVFLKPLKSRPGVLRIFSATVIGFAAITVFGRPGEFVRPYLIAKKEQVPVTSQMAAWILERMFDLLMALMCFAFALTRVSGARLHTGSRLLWVLATGGRIVGVLSLLILALILGMRHFAGPLRRWVSGARLERLLTAFLSGIESARSDAALLLVLFYSAIEWLLIVACYWCLARAFPGLEYFTFVDVLVMVGFIAFGAVVQIPGIGGGIQVVTVLVLTELFGIKLEIATSFAILLWIVTFVVVVPAGAVLAFKQGLDWHSLRRISREGSK